MPIADLLKNKRIISDDLEGDERTVAKDFVGRRVRALIDADRSLADPKKPGDITDAATPAAAMKLVDDVPKVRKAFTAIWTRVAADVAKNAHVPIDKPTLRKRVSNRPPTDARAMRRRLVLSIVFQAAASDMTLADTANVERLHRLCDRRLRIVERMLYEIGHHTERPWSRTQIRTHAGGPWTDGVERAFEYPRVPRWAFEETCQPDANDVCKPPMALWQLGDDRNLVGPVQTNPATTARWRPNAADNYRLDYTPAVAGSPKGVAAINELFAPSTDFLQRNLMYCDHTIHALHLEALVFAESKRRAAGDTAWLDGLVSTKGPGWLCILHPLVGPGALQPDQGKYLVGSGEPTFFEHLTVRANDLQVGDHLIVYNHPAYEFTTFHGAWKLENALVVQTSPGLLLQGHGTTLLTMNDAKAAMLNYFRQALDGCRAALRPLAAVTGPGPKPNTVKVSTTALLRLRHVDRHRRARHRHAAGARPADQEHRRPRARRGVRRRQCRRHGEARPAPTPCPPVQEVRRPSARDGHERHGDLPPASCRAREFELRAWQSRRRLVRRLGRQGPGRGHPQGQCADGVREEAALRRLHGRDRWHQHAHGGVVSPLRADAQGQESRAQGRQDRGDPAGHGRAGEHRRVDVVRPIPTSRARSCPSSGRRSSEPWRSPTFSRTCG